MFHSAEINLHWWAELRENLRRKQGWRFLVGLFCMVASCISFVITAVPSHFLPATSHIVHANWVMQLGLTAALLCFTGCISLTGRYFFSTWRRCNELSANEALAKDPRRPILYLRPFKADRLSYRTLQGRWIASMILFDGFGGLLVAGFKPRARAEELLVQVLEQLGPVIAIGRPGESIPELGASRVYVGDEWRDVVKTFLKRSQLIFMVAGITPNFEWEMSEVFRAKPFVPIVMMLPFHHRYQQSDVDVFIASFRRVSNLRLPRDLKKIRAVYLPDRISAIAIKDEETDVEYLLNGLNPFMGALTNILQPTRPDVRSAYTQIALNRREDLRLLSWHLGLAFAIVRTIGAVALSVPFM